MAQYDIFHNPEHSGYLLDVQSDLQEVLSTRLVIPLIPVSEAPKPATRLNPVIRIGNGSLIMVTQFMAAVPQKLLQTQVTSAAWMRDEVTAAIDMLTHGF